jgi:tetratricopeptide (TPR) repeat protein
MFKEMSHFYPKTLLLIARQMSDGYMEDHSKATAAFSVLCAGDALSLCLRDKTDRPADMHQMKDVWKNAEGAATYNDTGQDPNDEEFALTYFALGRAYLSRALRDGKMQFLSDAIRSYEASLDYFIQVYHRTGEDSVNRITVLINLAGAYQNQHDEQEAAPPDLSALRRGINHAREALALRPPGHPRRWEPLLSLGQLLDRLHKVRPSEDVFTEIVTYRREGLEQLPQGYGNRLGLMNEFAAFIQSQQPPLLTIELAEEAVQLMRAILQALPAGMARLQCMNNLAGALDKLYRVNHDASTIDEALSVYEAVLKELPKQNPLHHIVMDNLANSHNQRWAQTNDLSSVDASLRWRKEVLAYAPDHPNRGRTYHSLGVAHGIRFQKLRSIEDMEEGLRYFREALFTRKDPDGRVETLHQLSILLKKHYELTKNRSSLISCIKFLREVLKARQPPNPSFFAVSGQLAEVLMDESKELGEEESLRKSIDVCLHAVTHIQAADEEQARTLFSLLGGALIKDYMATGCLKTLDEAISALQQAESMGNDGTGKVLGDLITAFRLRSEKTDDLVDRDAMDRYSLQLRNSWIHSSDNGLKFRFAHHFVHQDSPDSLSTDDRDAVFASTKDFLEGTPRSHSGRYLACIQHAMILLDHPLGHFNFLEAMKLMVEATEAPVSSHTAAFDMLTRVLSDYNGFLEDELAQDEMEGGTHTWRTALLDVYIAVIRLFPKVVYFGLDQRDQLVSTQNGRFAAIAAASHALMLNKTNLALELLEQGRALFWNQALRLRARDAEFSGVPSDVALELKTIFGELDELHNSADEFIEQITWPAWARDSVAKARRQSVRAQQLIEEVRAQPGLDRFLLGPSYNDMSALAVDGHIIVVLVAHSRGVFQLSTSEAIIVTSPNEEPLHISLPLATVRRLAAMAEDLQNSNETYRSGVQAEMEASRGLRIARTVEDSGTTGVLKKLWFAVVKPIIDVLQLEVCALLLQRTLT